MIRSLTTRFRLLGFTFFILITLLHLVLYYMVSYALFSSIDKHLLEDTQTFESSYLSGSQPERSSIEVYTVRTPQGYVFDSSEDILLPPPSSVKELPQISTVKVNDNYYRMISYRMNNNFIAQYAINISSEISFLHTFKKLLFLSWFFFVCLLILLYLFILTPIQRSIVHLGEAITREELNRVYTYKEFEPLVSKFREYTEKLKELSLRQKNLLLALAHSVKTPLSVAILMIEDAILSGRKDLDPLKEELWRLENNINLFLRMAKLEESKAIVSLERLDIFSLIMDSLRLYDRSRLKLKGKSCYVFSDRQILLEILNILLDNAFRHGVNNCKVRVLIKDKPSCAEVLISNLSEKPIQPDKMFKPFEGKYTGIGLYVAKNLAQVVGADITIRQKQISRSIYLIVVKLTVPKQASHP